MCDRASPLRQSGRTRHGCHETHPTWVNPDLRQFVESLNEGLAEAILTGLRQDREERFHDAKTMQNALKPFSPWSVDQGSKALAKLMAELFEAEHALFVQDQQHGLLPKV